MSKSTVARAFALVMVLVFAVSCSPGSSTPADACPQRWDGLVTWSGREAATELQFYDEGRMTHRLPIKVQGATLSNPLVLGDGRASFVTLGNTVYDQTHIVSVDLTSCAVSMKRIEQASILEVSSSQNQLFSTTVLNNTGHLYVNDLVTGSQLADIQTLEAVSAGITTDERHLYVFNHTIGAEDDASGANPTQLLVIDRSTWQITERFTINSSALAVSDAVYVDGRIYFAATPASDDSQGPGKALGVIDLTTKKTTAINLPHESPYQIQVDPSRTHLYVAHTFLNDSYSSSESHRYVSRLDLGTGKITVIDTGPRLDQISLSTDGQRLLALHANYDEDVVGSYSVTEVARPEQTRSVPIEDHEGRDYFYLAAVTAR